MEWTEAAVVALLVAYLALWWYSQRISFETGFLFFLSTKFTLDSLWDFKFGGISPLHIVGTVFCLWLLFHVVIRWSACQRQMFFRPVMAVCIACAVSSVWGLLLNTFDVFPLVASRLTFGSILSWNARVLCLVLPLIVVPVLMPDSFRRVLVALAVSTFVPSVVGIIQVYDIALAAERIEHLHRTLVKMRVRGPYSDANTMALVMMSASLGSAYLVVILRRWWHRLAVASYSILTSVLLLSTYSRTFLVTYAVAMFLMAWTAERRSVWAMMAVGMTLLLADLPFLVERFSKEIDFLHKGGPDLGKLAAGRFNLWVEAWDHFWKLDPISKTVGSGGSYGSHNQYIAWILRHGWLGMLPFLYLLSRCVAGVRLSSAIHRPYGIAIILTTIVLSNLFAHPLENTSYAIATATVVGLAGGSAR